MAEAHTLAHSAQGNTHVSWTEENCLFFFNWLDILILSCHVYPYHVTMTPLVKVLFSFFSWGGSGVTDMMESPISSKHTHTPDARRHTQPNCTNSYNLTKRDMFLNTHIHCNSLIKGHPFTLNLFKPAVISKADKKAILHSQVHKCTQTFQ